MELSIVTSLYYSAAHLKEFYSRSRAAAEEITQDFEFILVNDGSPDNSLEIALNLLAEDPRVRVIDLSRNFGQHKAIMTGLAHSRGDLVYLLDCDLEEEPELLGSFYTRLRETGADVVYGVQDRRKGETFERLSGELFFKLFNLLSSFPVPRNLVHARLMSRRYVDSLVTHHDQEVYLPGLMIMTGFEQIPIRIRKHSRGTTTYNLRRRVALMVNAITSFSSKPLVYIFYLGSLISFLASLAALYLIIRRLFFGVYLEGWPSLIVSIWLLGGLTIFSLGIIGIYLSKIFLETKRRPYTLIRHIYESAENEPNSADQVWNPVIPISTKKLDD